MCACCCCLQTRATFHFTSQQSREFPIRALQKSNPAGWLAGSDARASSPKGQINSQTIFAELESTVSLLGSSGASSCEWFNVAAQRNTNNQTTITSGCKLKFMLSFKFLTDKIGSQLNGDDDDNERILTIGTASPSRGFVGFADGSRSSE